VYTFHSLIAKRWRDRRLLIAGDAAHQTPPFFGQGMCHGFRDVANLAWKLKAVLRGGADARVLETCQPEREPHVRAVIEAAIGAGRYICERDPAAAAKRDATLRAAMGKPAAASASDLIPPIRAGVVDPAGGPGTGARFIQPYVGYEGRRMLLDDATGGCFVVLAGSSLLSEIDDAQRSSLDRLGVRIFAVGNAASGFPALSDDRGDLAAWFAAHDAAAVVLRPDFYVYGMAYDSKTLATLTENLRKALAPAA